MPEAAVQRCPNCERTHDVSVYVTGQKVHCGCGIHFEVKREVKSSLPPGSRVSVRTEPAPRSTSLEPVPHAATRPDRGGAAPAIAATAVYKRVDVPGYELQELLGRGGMGEVWRARQLAAGRAVALKVLSPELAKDPEFVQRFQKEAAALSALSHPNIVQIMERGADAEARLFFFSMELCEGTSLRELMTADALRLPEKLDLMAQVGRAIDYAHGQGVIHRDLKPENILVDGARRAKVVDFGLAGMRGAQAQLNLTRAATAMGTLHYMAPEQRRDARSVDGRADVYSLGVILYELLTGDVPLGRFKLPSERRPGLDPRLDKIVSRALEAEPEARYASAKELTLDLEAVAGASSPTLPVAPAPLSPEGPVPDVRSRVARWLAALAILALAGVVLGSWLARPREASSAPVGSAAGASQMPVDTNADLPVAASRKGEDYLQISVEFRPGDGVLQAGTGEWKVADGALQARVFGTGTSGIWRPYATLGGPELLAAGLMLETTVALDPAPPAGYAPQQAPRAEVLLRGESGGRLSLSAIYGRKSGYELSYRPTEGEEIEERRSLSDGDELPAEPVPGKPLRLRLSAIGKGEIEVFAGVEEPLPLIFKRKLDVKDLRGRVALGCAEASCRFSRLEAVGRLAQMPKPPAPVDPEPDAP